MQKRNRNEQLIIRVKPEEKALIQKKMKLIGTENFSAYARKMLIDGIIIHVDLSEFQKLANEVNAVGVNVNQIAKVINSSGEIYRSDIAQVKEMVDEIWRLLKSYLSELLSLSR